MALKAINLDRCVIVAGTAKMFWGLVADRLSVTTKNRMARYALFQAVLFCANTLKYGFVALVHQKVHVIGAHKDCVPNTIFTLSLCWIWNKYTTIFGRLGLCSDKKYYQ